MLIAAMFALVPVQVVLAQGRSEEASVRREQAQARSLEARQNAQERVEQIKQNVQERKATIKQDVCERKQEQLTAAIPRLTTGASSNKKVLDIMYERVRGFYADGQLTVANYDELDANVAVAKAEAETMLAAVNSYEFVVDCNNPGLGEQLDGFRMSVNTAKDSLKAYRKQLVALISAMRAEAAEQSESSTESETVEGSGDGNEQ